MNSKTVSFTVFLCISFVLANGGILDSLKNKNAQEKSAGDSKGSWFGIKSKSTKALDQQNKQELELAMETTRLEELENLKEADKISDTTPSSKLSKWQKTLLNNISAAKKKKDDLAVKISASKSLAEITAPSSTDKEGQIKDRTSKLIKALRDQSKLQLKLAITSKQLEELKNQKEAEILLSDTAPIKLTKWQKHLLKQIVKAKEKKGDLTVEAAVLETKINELKKQLTAVGGSQNSINIISDKMKKQISEKLNKATIDQTTINMKLAQAKSTLEELVKQKNDENLDDENIKTHLTKKQSNLLNKIEKTKENIYDLTLKSALGNIKIEQLKLQLSLN